MNDSPILESTGQGKYLNWKFISDACTVLLFFSILFLSFSVTNADPDLWGHLKVGQDILNQHQIPTVDPYSYLTKGSKWFNHEWITQLTMGYLYDHLGAFGLCVSKVAVCLILTMLIYNELLRSGLTPLRGGFLLLLIHLVLLPGVQSFRPQMVTFLLFAVVLILIKHAEQGKYRQLLVLPFMFTAWVNLHGGFLSGFIIFLVWSFVHLLCSLITTIKTKSWRDDLPANVVICIAVIGSVLGVLLNPYGAELIQYVFQTGAEPIPDVTEWQPMTIRNGYAITYSMLLGLGVFALLKSKKRLPLPLKVIYVMLCIAPLVAVRHLPLFACSAILISDQLGSAWQKEAKQATWPRPLYIVLSATLLFESIFCIKLAIPQLFHIGVDTQFYPIRAVKMLKASGVTGNMALEPMGWGEYVIWHLGGRLKVSYDGRRDTLYRLNIRNMNLNFENGIHDWDQMLLAGPADLVLAQQGSATNNLMKLERDWQLAYEDKLCAIYAHPGSAAFEKVASAKKIPVAEDASEMYFP
jgi:hypothetical protein